jgi:hypothetical protein
LFHTVNALFGTTMPRSETGAWGADAGHDLPIPDLSNVPGARLCPLRKFALGLPKNLNHIVVSIPNDV